MSGCSSRLLNSDALELLASGFVRDGFAVLPDVIDGETLAMLREECANALAREDPHHFNPELTRDGRIFAYDCQRRQPRLRSYLFGALPAGICGALLGENAYVFLDQFIVKAPHDGAQFAWHQNSGYVVSCGGLPEHRPFLSLWLPLDDATVDNGALIVQPGSHRLGVQPHNNPSDHGEFATAAEGRQLPVERAKRGLVVLSSLLIHATGPNVTEAARRADLTQCIPKVMIGPGTQQLQRNAVPLLRDRKRATIA